MGGSMISKRSLFQRFLGFLNRTSHSEAMKAGEDEISYRFKPYLDELSEKDKSYATCKAAAVLCDDGIAVVFQRLRLMDKLNECNTELEKLECFNQLSEDEAAQIKSLLERFTSLAQEKTNLRYQITGFDSSLSYMEKLQDDAISAVDQIKEAEYKQRVFKQDISYLEGEKYNLELENDKLYGGLKFVKYFNIGSVIFFGSMSIILAFMQIFGGLNMVFPLAVMAVLVVIIYFLMTVLKRRLNYEIAVNAKKRNRAIELTNKKTVIYAHHTNFLNYEYNKYKVRSADMLKANIKDYDSYKHLTMRFDSIRNIMYQTEQEIERFIRAKNIDNMSATIEKFAKTMDIENKKEYYAELSREKQIIESNLQSLDVRSSEIWDELVILSELDDSEFRITDLIVSAYVEEAGLIIRKYGKTITEDIDKAEEVV